MEIGPPCYCKGCESSRDWTKNEGSITVERPLSSERSLVPLGNELMTEWENFLEYVISQK